MGAASVVYQYVKAVDLGEDFCHIRFAAHICRQGLAGDAVIFLKILCQGFQFPYGTAAGEYQVVSFFCEGFRRRPPNASGSSCYQGVFCLVLSLFHLRCLPFCLSEQACPVRFLHRQCSRLPFHHRACLLTSRFIIKRIHC